MIMSNYALRVMGDGKNGNIGADGGWGKKIEAHESEKIWRAQSLQTLCIFIILCLRRAILGTLKNGDCAKK